MSIVLILLCIWALFRWPLETVLVLAILGLAHVFGLIAGLLVLALVGFIALAT